MNSCKDKQRVVEVVNEIQERLLNRPEKPTGSTVIYRVCLSGDCVTWPRPVRTIEAFAVCSTPGRIVDNLFEFIGYPNGPGLLDTSSMFAGSLLSDRGTACAFNDVSASDASPRKIALIAGNASDAGKMVTLRYIDSNGQKKYSAIDGVIQEGERLTLPAPPAYVYTSSNVATNGLYHVVKDVTDYPVLMYEVDSATLIQTKQLSAYEPSETVPIYRRSLIPGLAQVNACQGVSTDCATNKIVTVLVKLQHVPVVVDNDPLVIGNLAAFKLMAMAIMREDAGRSDDAAKLEVQARAELDGELSSYLGDGAETRLKIQSRELFGAGFPALETAGYW